MENNASTILKGLNSEQAKAVTSVEGPVLIVAGAGSGKTRVLTSRIAYILEKGCDASRIMALTFTKKAASEMKERIALMVGEKRARKLQMGTFHSVFIRFLREYSDRLGYPRDFTIYDTGDSTSAIKACIKELQLDDKVYKPREVLSRISLAKNNLVTADAYRSNPNIINDDMRSRKPRICDLYSLYATKCRQAGVMDFDDILLNMNILLRDHKDVVEAIASRFSYLLVDEYQDTNVAQYLILKKLCYGHSNLCVVGDDSQSIYAFRGAKIANILNFKKDYPQCLTFRLEQNYRSTRTIVDAANSLIAHNEGRIPKKCFSEGDAGDKIHMIHAYNDQEEASMVASGIIDRMREASAQYQDFAILYRTNAQSRLLEEALRRRNLPYMIYSGNAFFDRAEVKDMMAYLKLAVNPYDDESFKRVVNKPARGIGGTSMDALVAAANARNISLFRAAGEPDLETFGLKQAAILKIRAFCQMIGEFAVAAKDADAYEIALRIADKSGLYAFFKEDTSIEGLSRLANIDELLNSVKQHVEQRIDEILGEEDMSGAEPSDKLPVVNLCDFLENIALLSNVDVAEDEDSTNKIALMTVHSAKGLEFPYVYVVGMEENIFPSGGMLASLADIEEERRLFYVALTRAQTAVALSYVNERMRNGKHENNSPSRFLKEIAPEYLDAPVAGGFGSDDDDDGDSDPFARRGGFGSKFGSRFGGGSGGRQTGRSTDGSQTGTTVRYGSGSRYGASSQVRFEPRSAKPASASQPAPAISSRPLSRPVPPAADEKDFVPSPISSLYAGARIRHPRFGAGLIKDISGVAPDQKAVIAFDEYGEKTILLKYSKLRLE